MFKADSLKSTLCFPDQEKSCFACCPPIRPAGYEHIQFKNIIRRLLRENTKLYKKDERKVIPIIGYSCWALGYLDHDYKLIGCMLHPKQNNDIDLRFRIDYGEKCARETCFEEKIFFSLTLMEQRFWLRLCEGFDSFAYSSKSINPLFNILGWGSPVLKAIYREEKTNDFTRDSFYRDYDFFSTDISPRANAYLLNAQADENNIHLLKNGSLEKQLPLLKGRIKNRIDDEFQLSDKGTYIHLLGLDQMFTDFLRFSMEITRIQPENASRIKEICDEELAEFRFS